MSTMTGESIEQLVHDTARANGIDPPAVDWSKSQFSRTHAGGKRITLAEHLVDDEEHARFSVHHELGHIALGHAAVPQLTLVAAGIMGSIVGPLVVGGLVGGLLAPTWSWDAFGLGLAVGVFAAFVFAAFTIRPLAHRGEYAADAWAARRGAVLTPQITDSWPRAGIFTAWAEWLLSDHPSPARRVKRAQQAAARS